MKRKDAFRKLRTICQRLDDVDPDEFYIIPLKLYMFGSALTEKPKPNDLDLFLEYKERPDNDPVELYHRLIYHKPLPVDQAITHLRRGMQMIRFECQTNGVDQWMHDLTIPENAQVRLVWQRSLNWQPIVDELEKQPLIWDEEKDIFYQQLKKRAEEIETSKGSRAARDWMEAQLLAYHKIK